MTEETEPKPPVVDGTTSFDETPGDTTVTGGGDIVDRKEPPTFEQAPTPQPEQASNAPDHTQTAPQADPTDAGDSGKIYLPRLIADEYGMAEGNAVDTVLTATAVTVDGVEVQGDRRWLPYDMIVGKEIIVAGPYRSVRFTYAG